MAPAVAQTCRDDIPASTPDSRFTANGDGTVTDRATRLIWKQCAEGLSGTDCQTGSALTLTWQAALQRAADAEFAGSSLWRLPSITELESLVEQRCYNPAINSRYFPNTPARAYWSSSPAAWSFTNHAWHIYFYLGFVDVSYRSDPDYVRLVRGGQ